MKKIACLTVFFGLCVLVVAVGAGELRTWTASGGKFTTEAEFIETSPDGTMVSLRKKDGKEIQIVIERLSEEDREYIANPKKTSPANPAEQKPVDDSTFKVTEERENKKDTLRVPVGIWAKKQYDILFKLSKERINEPQSVIDDYKRRAENNELEAQLRIGCYYFGNKQNEEAIKALEQAANRTENTKTEQMVTASLLGVFCFAIEDYKGALKWTRKSADLGSEDANEFLLEVQMASAGRKGYKDGDALRAAQAKQPKNASAHDKPPKIVDEREGYIKAITSRIKNKEDLQAVRLWLVNYPITYNPVESVIICSHGMPPGSIARRNSYIITEGMFHISGKMGNGFIVSTCDSEALHPIGMQVTDRSGEVWKSMSLEWTSRKVNFNGKTWVTEDAILSLGTLTEKDSTAIIGAIIRNDACVIKIIGAKGSREIPITHSQSVEFNLFYNAYKVLKKYYK